MQKKRKTKGGSTDERNKRYKPCKSRERERESLNIKDIGFINNAEKLYIKYKELKIKLTDRSQKSNIRFLFVNLIF